MVLAAGLTFERAKPTGAESRDPAAMVASMTARELAARMFMLPVSGTSLSSEDEAKLRNLKPGGVILVQANFGTPDNVRDLVAAIHATNPALPPLVALDQEGGLVSRIANDPAPGAPDLGLLPPAEISEFARLRAVTLADYGFDVNFAPVADVALTPDSFMTGRTFGSDPTVVAECVRAYLEGVTGTGVLHCVKHFPGHGRVSVDSHEALPTLDVDTETWWETDALPFRVAVEAGVPMVMLGHLVLPAWGDLPASLSPAAVNVLREDLGFEGVIVSDDLGMGALSTWDSNQIIDLAVAAGNDLLLFVVTAATPEEMIDHLVQSVDEGNVPIARVQASVTRILAMQFGPARQG
jgi:beta-N-acetylhexosaminidase